MFVALLQGRVTRVTGFYVFYLLRGVRESVGDVEC